MKFWYGAGKFYGNKENRVFGQKLLKERREIRSTGG